MPTLLAGKLKSSGLAFIFGVVARLKSMQGRSAAESQTWTLQQMGLPAELRPTRFFCIHGIRWPAVCCKSSFVGSDSWLHQCL